MTFIDREKQRLIPLKPQLFSAEACEPGYYGKVSRGFCLRDDRAEENLHTTIRDEPIVYFKERKIRWHDSKKGRPSNHLCCSQCCCVNFRFPFVSAPDKLAAVLRNLGYDVAQMLPFELDEKLKDGSSPYVAFEWIGERNYLKELSGGKVASDRGRKRGANFTSLDFAFRFRRTDGRIQIVAGEWKYTEKYTGKDLRISRSGTDRLCIYRPYMEQPDCQINLGCVSLGALFFDPFDQLMRQQLLCSSMERHHEMGADIVSLLHVAPAANKNLMDRVTSPELKSVGSDIHQIWAKLVSSERFSGVFTEDLLPLVCQYAPVPEWATYMQLRYGSMQ